MYSLARAELKVGNAAAARALASDCLEIRRRKAPDDWRTFDSRSLLGACLLGEKNYAEAEPLLIQGYEGMKARETRLPALGKKRLAEAAARMVQLYDAWGKKDQADDWRKATPARPGRRQDNATIAGA